MTEPVTEPVDPLQPVADVLAQRQDVGPAEPADSTPELPAEADPGDVAEQQRELSGFDDEEGPDHG